MMMVMELRICIFLMKKVSAKFSGFFLVLGPIIIIIIIQNVFLYSSQDEKKQNLLINFFLWWWWWWWENAVNNDVFLFTKHYSVILFSFSFFNSDIMIDFNRPLMFIHSFYFSSFFAFNSFNVIINKSIGTSSSSWKS